GGPGAIPRVSGFRAAPAAGVRDPDRRVRAATDAGPAGGPAARSPSRGAVPHFGGDVRDDGAVRGARIGAGGVLPARPRPAQPCPQSSGVGGGHVRAYRRLPPAGSLRRSAAHRPPAPSAAATVFVAWL